MKYERCERCGQTVAWTGIGTNSLLVILKFIVGMTSGSLGLRADALYSASNIVTAFAIMVSQKVQRNRHTDRFPYGNGKVEFLAAGFISLLVMAGAIALLWVAIRHIVHSVSEPPNVSALLMSVVSIGTSEMLFRYMRCVGTELRSQTILASAESNRAGCLSSVTVMMGVVGAQIGLYQLDSVAAFVVVMIIVKVNVNILVDSVNALMDSSVNDLYGAEIESIVSSVNGVKAISGLKTRRIGQKVLVDVDICLDPEHTIGEAQTILGEVRQRLRRIRELGKIVVNCRPVKG